MVIYFSESLQIAIDCVALLGPRQHLICGWVMTPRGTPFDMRVLGPQGHEHRAAFRLLYARPDVTPPDPQAALVSGFTLVVEGVPESGALEVMLRSGELGGRINLRDSSISRDLQAVIAGQDWRINFRLLRAALERGEGLPLMRHQYRPYGAFAAWIARLPLVKQRAEQFGIMARLECLASPAGEYALGVQFAGRPERRLQIETIAIGALRAEDGGPDEMVLLPQEDGVAHQAANFGCAYGRVPPALLPRLRRLELVAQVSFDEEMLWLRAEPRAEPVPGFLDGLALLPGEAMDGSIAAALLQGVLANRERGMLPALEALARATPRPSGQPGLAIMVGVDEPACVPLLDILAPRIEAMCESLLLVGQRAEQAVQVFRRRGRIRASTEREAAIALGRAAEAGAAVVPLDPLRLGRAVIEDDLAALFAHRLEGEELALLRHLHAAAGCSADLADSLARLLRLREQPGQPWQPPGHAWRSPLAAHLANAHLERLWTLPARPLPAEADPGPASPAPVEVPA
ncbi:hypothetical protein [Teichococcus cervicalis]|uniref:Uncharacterized protein n=1 Tax=Pseudoroseomonas cervicalis ATCC 49957 TaxID=525371 RepID=D5RK27_9PROT|nr:hypothetical protein [Pseudoroseomonas cervicalis]EFH12336.1 hypothetical protein HMPREF0731_1437 [Pseudoroseomonas cervicalis ATCC 49957]